MRAKKRILLLIASLWIIFLFPNYVRAAFTFSAHDTNGRLLSFKSPVLIIGTGSTDGAGAASIGAQYMYTNVITVDGIQVNAVVSVDNMVNATLNMFDDPNPNPTASDSSRINTTGTVDNYSTSFGAVVPEDAIFAPQITSNNRTKDSYVQFTINFQDNAGKPVVLKNVYNNTLDVESVEFNEYGGFVSYLFSSDYLTNPYQHMIANQGLNGNIRFSNSNCDGNPGLYITDSSRVQTKFDTISSITLVNGQFANNAVPDGNGGSVTCNNITTRYYGAIFVQDNFVETGDPAIEVIAPTVNSLITSNTKPTITGTLGGFVSSSNPQGSPLVAGDTFSVFVGGMTYTYPNANLSVSGVQWTLNVPTTLAVGTYEITATRNGKLIDQTHNELIITALCALPQVINATGSGCVTPGATDDIICHTGDTSDENGDGIENYDDDRIRPYTKILSNKQLITGHETHPHDYNADSNGHCPDDPVVCTLPQIRDAAKNMCVTPLSCTLPAILNAAGTACVTSSVPTVVSQVSISTTPTITGTVGNLTLSATESFSILLNGITYSLSDVNLVVSGTKWTLTVPTPLTRGTAYSVTATRDGSLVDTTTNELTIVGVPTVTSQTTTTLTPTIKGTVGNAVLNAGETFTVVVNGVTFSSGGQLSISGMNWTLNVPSSTALKASSTYDVTATRSGILVDATSGELVITTATCSASQTLDTVTNTCKTNCLATQYLNASNACVPRSHSCTKVDSSIPATSDYNAATMTMSICHFTPGSGAAQKITIKMSDISSYLDDRGDSIWENDNTKMCPELESDCDVIPTVNYTTSLDSVIPKLTGSLGSSRSLTITINDSTGATKATGAAVISNGQWSYSPSTPLPAGVYDVVATGDVAHGSLADKTTNELTVTAAVLPTVNVTTTTDQIAPKLTGTMGSSTSLTIAIIDSAGVTKVSGVASVSGSNWSYSPGIIAAGTYNVVATGDATHGNLVDSTTNELTVTTSSIPTVNFATTIDKIAPTLSGTIGASTGLTISINDSSGVTKASGTASISGINWTFKPANPIAAGVYDVVAMGDPNHGSLVDATKNELTVTGSVIPTVNPTTTNDKLAPMLNGTIGTSTSLNIVIKDSSGVVKTSGSASINPPSVNWSFTSKVPLPVGTYDVVVTGDPASGNLVDATTDELTVIASAVPTVDNVTTTDKVAPKLTGTVGTSTVIKVKIVDSGGNTKMKSSTAKISGTTWSYTPSSTFSAGTYNVVATGDGVLVDTTSNELTVTASVLPTVNTMTTTDKAIPVVTGTVGSSASLTIAIKSGTTTKSTGPAIISGSNWNYSPPNSLVAGTYEVVATGDKASGSLVDTSNNELTILKCTVPQVYSTNKDACITPIPTVVAQSIQSLIPVAPVITGTIGASVLDTTETFTVTVNKQSYDKNNSALVINDVNWTLIIPSTIPLPFGNYDVVAARNTVSKDKTTNELKIILICELPLVADGTGKGCVPPGVFPTVDTQTTDNTMPVITGTVGDSALGQTEMFSVNVSGVDYDRTQMTFNNTSWSLAIPTKLSPGTYDVIALRGNTLIEGNAKMDRTVNELIITPCDLPKTIDPATGACILPGNQIPTVDKLTTNSTMPTLTGTVGTTSLGNNDVFTVAVNGVTYKQSTVIVSGTSWSLTIPAELPAGKTYDVDALRNSTLDKTSSELTITDNIDICDMSKTPHDQSISRSAWESTKASENYYLGKCDAPPCDVDTVTGITLNTPLDCTPPLPKKEDKNVLPTKPDALVDEAKTVNGVQTCDVVLGGGVLGGSTTEKSTNVSIKRARIANASTENGVFDTDTLIGTKVKFGVKTIGAVDISQAIITKGKARNVTITGARLEDVYIDTANDYIDTNGNVIAAGTWISVRGGTTKVNTTKEDNSITRAVITSGMVTSGQDASGNQMRGRITHGLYETDISNQNADGTQNIDVLTKGRRTKGTLLNATITNATTTTVDGVTVVNDGTITANADGTPITMDSKTTTSTFGSVINAIVTGGVISNSNTCFTGGKIGTNGQLTWEEVVE